MRANGSRNHLKKTVSKKTLNNLEEKKGDGRVVSHWGKGRGEVLSGSGKDVLTLAQKFLGEKKSRLKIEKCRVGGRVDVVTRSNEGEVTISLGVHEKL